MASSSQAVGLLAALVVLDCSGFHGARGLDAAATADAATETATGTDAHAGEDVSPPDDVACVATGEVCNGADDDCDRVADDGCPTGLSVSGRAASPLFGNDSAHPYEGVCPAGQVIGGVRIRTVPYVNELVASCVVMEVVEDRTAVPYRYRVTTRPGSAIPTFGSPSGSIFTSDCASGSVLTGVTVATGNLIDSVTLRCAPIEISGAPGAVVVRLGTAVTSPRYGGAGGAIHPPFDCATDSAANGLFGYVDDRSAPIGLGIDCTQLQTVVR